ncbi:hypothetical protein EUGRSUZ_D01824 [Eucalyptus grandis]|uniref:Uncharacterized protein n=2 Tax=Eucalyptus grandis TaxID=71139 RepID=A0ACC3L5X9_EUCGR|nr:hypothetical protein EUGRSUZ_D01824 [Eucalyptus grandis]
MCNLTIENWQSCQCRACLDSSEHIGYNSMILRSLHVLVFREDLLGNVKWGAYCIPFLLFSSGFCPHRLNELRSLQYKNTMQGFITWPLVDLCTCCCIISWRTSSEDKRLREPSAGS